MKPILAALALAAVSGVLADDEHPLDAFFSAEVLPDEDAKKVKTNFQITERSPYSVEMEIYHTDLDKEILGAVIEVKAEAIDLTYEMLIQVTATPYTRVQGEALLFRGDDLVEANPVFTVKEFRYEELPEIDDPSKEDEDDDDS